MNIEDLLPRHSPRLRASLYLLKFAGDTLLEADNIRMEEEQKQGQDVPDRVSLFEQTAREAGFDIPELARALAVLTGGGGDREAALHTLIELSRRYPNLGGFLEGLGVTVCGEGAPPPGPEAPSETAGQAKASAPTEPPGPVNSPDLALSLARIDELTERVDRLEHETKAHFDQLERTLSALRQQMTAELSTSRLLERVECLREGLGPACDLH